MREGGREGEGGRGGEDMHACIHARTVIAQAFMVYGVSESVSIFCTFFHLCIQGGTARRWEAELEETEKKLRDHLDMLVKSETIAGCTRDRARSLTRCIPASSSSIYSQPTRPTATESSSRSQTAEEDSTTVLPKR